MAGELSGEGVRASEVRLTEQQRVEGRADGQIVALAEELDAGMVKVGNCGLGDVGRVLIGSVSDSVVRHAHCPVLVVRREVG